ncbi:transcriptional regulator GcvA [Variovorax terrae]|uniref:Transcriptional regulator GcvA n=1 Tax=Variovorax terrae TaxID=2923278 RepID=A0A9X1W1J8_9BURK|nr:transcriptional regulator GcvA [Variovorax terrae]MCJ0764453.1 transcriptional regulator GcvA [Variovorax terrae]
MKKTRLPSTAALLAFESAARHLNFSRAAAELHLTQGAVSHQVRQLEAQLGVALFERVRQRVLLTGAGVRYLGEVERILGDLAQTTHRAMAAGDKEVLNLAVVPTFAAKWLVPRLHDFLARHPDVNVNFVSRNAPFDFDKEPFDAAIHYGEPTWAHAFVSPIMEEDMIPVCSRTFRQRHRIRTPQDLARAALLQQFTRPSAWADWFSQFELDGEHLFRGLRFDSFNMICEGVRASLGAALLPRFLVEEEIARGDFVLLAPQGLPSSRGYHLVCPEAKRDAPAVQAFRDWLTEVVRRPT